MMMALLAGTEEDSCTTALLAGREGCMQLHDGWARGVHAATRGRGRGVRELRALCLVPTICYWLCRERVGYWLCERGAATR